MTEIEQLANKLAQVTAALVDADTLLAHRVRRIEDTLDQLFLNGVTPIDELGARAFTEWNGRRPETDWAHPGPQESRRGLLSRVTRRTPTHQGAGPEGTE